MGNAPDERSRASGTDKTRFPHVVHTGDREEIQTYKGRGLQCTDCHSRESIESGVPVRPGTRQHAPCDECHKREFYRPPGRFCQNCHIETRIPGDTLVTLQPYPQRGRERVLASRFSHAMHLDRARMDAAVGFHVSCADCHGPADGASEPSLPGHKQCMRCHATSPKGDSKNDSKNGQGSDDERGSPAPLNQCQTCHRQRDFELSRTRVFITGDLVFSHASHERDISGRDVACAECHADIPESRSAVQVSVPRMRQCATCHEDARRTPDRVRIAECHVCHGEVQRGEPPPGHRVQGSTSQVPEDHTIEFRTHHGQQAASPDAKCSYCHEGLTRQSRDNCHQCHTVMRPRDHDLSFYDGHGRHAASDRDRCATCHTGDECVACHQVTPRSHTPLGAFRLGGHATAARVNTRSCFACHTFEDTCANCHRGIR